jgi:hypothetical protein
MTAIEFRVKNPSNIRLKWLIYGHHIELEELEKFTQDELTQIYRVDDRKKIRDYIMLIFQANVWNTEPLI